MRERRKRGPRSLHGDRPVVGELPVDEDVDREVRAHLDLLVDELVREGWDAAAARAEARRRFGDTDAVRRECEAITRSRDRALRRAHGAEAVMQDLRYAVRTLVASPGFTLVALITLALGIGANTAIFSVVNGVLLRPLPYDAPEELVYVQERSNSGNPMSVAWANFQDWERESRSFEALAAFGGGTTTVVGGEEPVRVPVGSITRGFWTVFPLRPLAGRLTGPDDHRLGAAPAVVVSRTFVANVLGGGDAVGRVLEIGGRRAEVVGVVPGGFDFPSGAQVWVPVELTEQGSSRTAHNWETVGRLGEGVSLDAAREEVDALTRRIVAADAAEEGSADYLAVGAIVVPLQEEMVGNARQPILVLLGAAGFVLLVACTNLASTLLARGTVRSREMAVRSSLGAPRGRLIRQLLTESGVLAAAGAAAGVGVALLLMRLIRSVGAASVPRIENVQLDAGVLAFTFGVAALTSVVFGLLPALRVAEGAEAGTLRQGGRGSAGGRTRIWGVLVGTEVALALVLLVGAGLLVRSLGLLAAQDMGFDESDVITTPVSLGAERYPELDDHRLFWDRFLPALAADPAIAAAGVVSTVPMRGWVPTGRLELDGRADRYTDAAYVAMSEGAFEALDVALVRGRLFGPEDGPDDPHAVVVNRSFAEATWPGEDPLGKQVSGGGMDDYWSVDPPVFGTVVGVVEDVRYRDLARSAVPAVYFSARQRPFRLRFSATLVAEASSGDAGAIAGAVRQALRTADPAVAVELRTLSDWVGQSLAQRRFVLTVLGGFSVLALVLAAVGIYGVVAYTVARQTREIGVRLALGAPPARVRAQVLRGALATVAAGLVFGVVGGLALTRFLRGFLFGVSATDPATFAGMAAVLLGCALLASWIPARRSTRVDPMITMRAE